MTFSTMLSKTFLSNSLNTGASVRSLRIASILLCKSFSTSASPCSLCFPQKRHTTRRHSRPKSSSPLRRRPPARTDGVRLSTKPTVCAVDRSTSALFSRASPRRSLMRWTPSRSFLLFRSRTSLPIQETGRIASGRSDASLLSSEKPREYNGRHNQPGSQNPEYVRNQKQRHEARSLSSKAAVSSGLPLQEELLRRIRTSGHLSSEI